MSSLSSALALAAGLKVLLHSAASVATDPLGVDEEPKVTGWEDLTADEIAARRALEYREEDVTYVEVQERIAAVSLEKLPRPQSTNGQVRCLCVL